MLFHNKTVFITAQGQQEKNSRLLGDLLLIYFLLSIDQIHNNMIK